MNIIRNTLLLGIAGASLLCLDNLPGNPVDIGFIARAEAIIGRPATPMSYAGVARRTTYRAVETTAVVATTAAVASTSAPATLAVGSAVPALPTGCESAVIGGVTYQKCGGVYYRPAYQGNTLVYIVSAP